MNKDKMYNIIKKTNIIEAYTMLKNNEAVAFTFGETILNVLYLEDLRKHWSFEMWITNEFYMLEYSDEYNESINQEDVEFKNIKNQVMGLYNQLTQYRTLKPDDFEWKVSNIKVENTSNEKIKEFSKNIYKMAKNIREFNELDKIIREDE